MIKLEASPREAGKNVVKTLREEERIPAVVYGAKVEAAPISVGRADLEKILREEGETVLITLTGLGEDHEVLMHDIEVDPVKGFVSHIDFYAVERGKEIEVTVPFEFIGESAAEKGGANIVKTMHELDVKTTPGKIPSHIEVDLAKLAAVGDQILIKDITFPEGVAPVAEEDEVVILAQEHVEEAEEETTAVDMDSIEVAQKGKEEQEGGEEE
ncbi:MAG: 50S ribosomal protein L25 [Patescibacteria group bacterium UBA2103]